MCVICIGEPIMDQGISVFTSMTQVAVNCCQPFPKTCKSKENCKHVDRENIESTETASKFKILIYLSDQKSLMPIIIRNTGAFITSYDGAYTMHNGISFRSCTKGRTASFSV